VTKPAIVVTGADLAPQALELLQKFEIVYAGKTPDEESLVKLCEQTQPVAILVRYGKVPARVMDASRNLKVIAKHGVGIDTIDSQAAAARGIAVKSAVGANADAVAEHTWALIFDCAKGISHLNARMHKGHWDKATHKSLELKGKTLGLVGLGAIGQRVASVGMALGMRVIAFDPYAAKAPAGITMCELATVVAESDVLSLHCPLTPENRNMINRDVLARMRDGAIVVNTARGGLVDEAALLDAVTSGKLRAAGLDSFQTEPMASPHIFHGVANITLTPHTGGITSDAYVSMGTAAARNILAVLAETESELAEGDA
jgi:D-3-phosphoglycerate dehydrogenase / 2-oxoglutarate reductase